MNNYNQCYVYIQYHKITTPFIQIVVHFGVNYIEIKFEFVDGCKSSLNIQVSLF